MASFTELGAVQSNLVDRDFRANAMDQPLTPVTQARTDAVGKYRNLSKNMNTGWRKAATTGVPLGVNDRGTIDYQRGQSAIKLPTGQLMGIPTALLQQLSYGEAINEGRGGGMSDYFAAPKQGMHANYGVQADFLNQLTKKPQFAGQGGVIDRPLAEERFQEAIARSKALQQPQQESFGPRGVSTFATQAKQLKSEQDKALAALDRARRRESTQRSDAILQTAVAAKELKKIQPTMSNLPIKETVIR